MERETIMIDGVRYYADRPRSCRNLLEMTMKADREKEPASYILFR